MSQWDLLWNLETKRKAKDGERHQMTKDFIALITPEVFLEEARHTFSLLEICRYYGNSLETISDLDKLLADMSDSHAECFDFAVYFAAWIKEEVHVSKREFKDFDLMV